MHPIAMLGNMAHTLIQTVSQQLRHDNAPA
jgi:hypothetical protein